MDGVFVMLRIMYEYDKARLIVMDNSSPSSVEVTELVCSPKVDLGNINYLAQLKLIFSAIGLIGFTRIVKDMFGFFKKYYNRAINHNNTRLRIKRL